MRIGIKKKSPPERKGAYGVSTAGSVALNNELSAQKVGSKLSVKSKEEDEAVLQKMNSDVNYTDQKPLVGKISELNAELNSIVASS